jgi:hypothetical protein
MSGIGFSGLLLLGALGGLAFPDLFLILFFFGVCIVGTVLWIWALVDCLTKEADTGNNKVAWVLVVALTHFVGALIYLLVRRPKRIAELGR